MSNPPGIVLSEIVKALLLDPRIFNFLIMGLYALSAIRWAFAGKWADMCYWLSALAITATVTAKCRFRRLRQTETL